jgi:hypothetical protein
MKRLLTIATLLFAFAVPLQAQEYMYLPDEQEAQIEKSPIQLLDNYLVINDLSLLDNVGFEWREATGFYQVTFGFTLPEDVYTALNTEWRDWYRPYEPQNKVNPEIDLKPESIAISKDALTSYKEDGVWKPASFTIIDRGASKTLYIRAHVSSENVWSTIRETFKESLDTYQMPLYSKMERPWFYRETYKK